MPDCNYCGETFPDEESYLAHLRADHDESELSRIDRRRVETEASPDGGFGLPVGPTVLAGLVVLALGVTVYVTFFVGGDGGGSASAGPAGEVAQTPTGVGTVHEHGTMEVVVDGERVDFSRDEYQRQDRAFHFENGNGEMWHAHARGVTLEYALATLDIQVNETAVVYDGTVYRDGDPNTTVTVEVNGEPVDPETYVLDGVENEANADRGDHVRVVVETDQ